MYHPLLRQTSLRRHGGKERCGEKGRGWPEIECFWTGLSGKPVIVQLDYVYELCVFLAYVPLSSVKFLWKIPACFAMLRETMLFCLCSSQRVRTTLSLSGVEGRMGQGGGWHGVTVDTKWEKPKRETLCTHTPGPFSPVCIAARGRAVKGGKCLFTGVVVLSWLQML